MRGNVYFQGKPVFIKVHAVTRARQRQIAYPDEVYSTLQTGKVRRFSKNGIKFIKRSGKGSIICVGEDLGYGIIIKTVEKGN